MDKLGDILSKKFNDGNFANLTRPAWICFVLNQKLKNCQAKSFRKGVVTLVAPDYPQAAILKMNKIKLLKDFAAWLGSDEIIQIKIIIGQI